MDFTRKPIWIRGVEHIYNLHTLNSPHNDREWHCLSSSPLLEPCWSHILKWEWQFVFYQHLKSDGHTFPPPPSHRHWINDGVATEKTRTSLDGLLHKLGHWLDVKRIKHLTGTGRQRKREGEQEGQRWMWLCCGDGPGAAGCSAHFGLIRAVISLSS